MSAASDVFNMGARANFFTRAPHVVTRALISHVAPLRGRKVRWQPRIRRPSEGVYSAGAVFEHVFDRANLR